MADTKPKLIRGKGRPGFKMTKPASFPHLQKQSFEARIADKTARDVAQLKKTQEAGRTRIRAAASQKRAKAVKVTGERFREAMQKTAAKKTGSALVQYKAPQAKPTAPTPSPTEAPKPAASKYGRVGRSKIGKLLTGQYGRNLITGAAGKGLLRRAATGIIGTGLKLAGPIGAAYGAAAGTYSTVKEAKKAIKIGKPVFTFGGEAKMRKRSRAKYGTLEAAARTRRAMTGK